jgi:septal ring factor EnvC (AmiA/AmiB activator)
LNSIDALEKWRITMKNKSTIILSVILALSIIFGIVFFVKNSSKLEALLISEEKLSDYGKKLQKAESLLEAEKKAGETLKAELKSGNTKLEVIQEELEISKSRIASLQKELVKAKYMYS